MKTCTKCNEEKPLSAFLKSKKNPKTGKRYGDGRRPVCKACAQADWMKWRSLMSEQERRAFMDDRAAKQKAWDKKRPHYQKAAKANLHARRVKASGVVSEQEVAAVWYEWNGLCWCCGCEATEVDHFRPINRAGGGTNTADNIRPICRECNQKRSHKWHGETIANKEAKMLKALKELLA